jgi:hypothetical protein
MLLTIKGLTEKENSTVEMVLEPLWKWESLGDEECLTLGGISYLCGGESEEHFFQRCCEAVWGELGKYVEVEIDATYMEELPYETYISDEDEYAGFEQRRQSYLEGR